MSEQLPVGQRIKVHTPTTLFFVKQEKEEYHQVASRRDDWVPPPQFEIRAVPIESDRPRR